MIARGPGRLGSEWAALVVLAGYVLLATSYAVLVPLGETPDEVGHFEFVRYVAEQHRLPVQEPRPGNTVGEGHQAPLYYLLGAGLTAGIDASDLKTFRVNPHLTFTVDPVGNKHSMVRTLAETWPPTGYALAWRVCRALSIVCGLVAAGLVYAFALVAFAGRRPLAVAALALFAFNPQFVFVSGGIGTDTLAAAAGAAMLLVTARALVHADSPRRGAVLLGLAIGVALLTKLTLAVLAVVCVAGYAVAVRREPRRLVGRLALVGGLAALLSGWWFVRNVVLYGDPFALSIDRAQNPSLVGAGTVDFQLLKSLLLTLRDSYFARFGWMNVAPPLRVYDLLTWLLALAGVGLAWYAVGAVRRHPTAEARGRVLVLAGSALLAYLVALFVFAIGKGPSGYQGRYAFAVGAAVAVCLALGLSRWWPRAHQWGFAGLAALVGVAATSYCLVRVILPAYPEPLPIYPPSRMIVPATPVGATLGDKVTLVGYDRGGGDWRAGAAGELTLYWRARDRLPVDYTVFVHLVDRSGRLVAQHDGQPGLGRAPTSFWLPGETILDRHRLDLAGVASGDYEVRVGMYDLVTQRRLPVAAGGPGARDDYFALDAPVR